MKKVKIRKMRAALMIIQNKNNGAKRVDNGNVIVYNAVNKDSWLCDNDRNDSA